MKLKNTCHKIISVGEVIILPGDTQEVAGFDGNDVLNFHIERGDLTVVNDATAPASSEETEVDDKKEKDIGKMNKAELVEKCRELGIAVSEEDTKDVLIGKIESAKK